MIHKKVLFIHNSIPEYRIEFWRELNKLIKFDLLITNVGLEDKIYNLEKNTDGLNVAYWDKDFRKNLKKRLSLYTTVVLAPADTFKEFWIDCLVLNICRKRQITCVYWSEKWEAPWKLQPTIKKVKNILQRISISFLIKNCQRSIASGEKSFRYLEMLGVNRNKISIVIDSSTSNECSDINIKKLYGINHNKKVILYMGRLISRKGCDILIKATKKILLSENAVLLICGEGERLCEYKKIANNDENIIFTGAISPMQRKAYYKQADVFVLPSICENGIIEAWGLTVNEALECGTPVIVSEFVGSAYDLINEENGLMIKNMNPENLRDAIQYVLSKKTYNRVTIMKLYEKYSVDQMALHFANALER